MAKRPRQIQNNKARFKKMTDKLIFYSDDGEEILRFVAVEHAIREADVRTIDNRTVSRWIMRLMEPPWAIWKDRAVLVPLHPAPHGEMVPANIQQLKRPNGEPNPELLRRVRYQVQLPLQLNIPLIVEMDNEMKVVMR